MKIVPPKAIKELKKMSTWMQEIMAMEYDPEREKTKQIPNERRSIRY